MNLYTFRRTAAIARKEVYHVMRDPITLLAALGLPVFMVIMFGVSIEFNVKNIELVVSDASQTQSSRRLIDTFSSSKYFQIQAGQSPNESVDKLISEEARAALIIPASFEEDIFKGRVAQVQMLLDGSDSATVAPILGYVGAIQGLASKRLAGAEFPQAYQVRSRFLFNPELNSRWFVIPGLIVLVMAILSTLLTALTIAREFEGGSMEILLSTPLRPIEIIVGKLVPYAALGIASVLFTYIIARTVFGVPFVGSYLLFGIGVILFLIAQLAQGLLVSVITRNQAMAMQMSFLVGMLPAVYLSGFVFPVESMPVVFQYFTALLPARWFMEISRDCFLKGTGFTALMPAFAGLTLFVAVIIGIASRKFKRDLEP